MIIRDANLSDVPSIVDIYNWAIEHTTATFDLYPQTLVERQQGFAKDGSKTPTIVAEVGKRVVGYCSLSRHREKPAYARTVESSIYIDPAHQGHGIGTLLMKDMLRRATLLNYHAVIAGVADGNDVSTRLHLSLGFIHVGRFREVGFKFGRWLDVDYYELFLADPS